MSIKESQQTKATLFRTLHQKPSILVLPNVWDAASAKMFEQAGFAALATSSAGIANSWGYPDGERMSLEEMLIIIRRITQTTSLPVTADMETGFGVTPDEVAQSTKRVLEAGAIGLNLEDGVIGTPEQLADISLQVERIQAVRQAGDDYGVQLLINARTDVFERCSADHTKLLAKAIERGNIYREAGADCIFVMSVDDKHSIAELVREIAAPINVLAREQSPTIAELEQLGVARVSFGSIPMRATMSLLIRIADEIKQEGTYSFSRNILSYSELNGYFEN